MRINFRFPAAQNWQQNYTADSGSSGTRGRRGIAALKAAKRAASAAAGFGVCTRFESLSAGA